MISVIIIAVRIIYDNIYVITVQYDLVYPDI